MAVQVIIPGATIYGLLSKPDEHPMRLRNGMMEVRLPGNVYIDVSWFPEHDANGEYRIVMFHDDYENKIAEGATKDPVVAEEMIKDFAHSLCSFSAKQDHFPSWLGLGKKLFSWIVPKGATPRSVIATQSKVDYVY